MAQLVRAAAQIAASSSAAARSFGGLAVSARVGQAHRATADIDAVVDDLTPPPAVDALLDVPGAQSDPTGEHRVVIDGIKVEIQSTEPITAQDLVRDDLEIRPVLDTIIRRWTRLVPTTCTSVAALRARRTKLPTEHIVPWSHRR